MTVHITRYMCQLRVFFLNSVVTPLDDLKLKKEHDYLIRIPSLGQYLFLTAKGVQGSSVLKN